MSFPWSMGGVGRDGLPGTTAGQPSREPTRELLPAAWRGWMGRPGIRDEMIRTTPRLASSVRTLWLGAHDADWTREYPDDVTPTDRELSYLEVSQRILDRMTQDRYSGVSGRGSWRQYLADTFILRHTCGSDATEAGWTDDGRLELYSTPPSTWFWWHSTSRGIERLDLCGADGMYRSVPRERLILVPLHPEEGPESWCEMRSLFARTNIAALAEQAWLRATRLWAGMIKAQETIAGKADPAVRLVVERMLRDYEDGTRQSLLVPHGVDVEASFPSGSPPSVVEYLQLAAGDIDHWAGQWLASLGAVAGSGSRALGESMRAEDQAQWVSTLREHGRSQGRAVDEYLAVALGYEGIRFPSWTVAISEGVDGAALSRVIAANVAAGLLPAPGPAARRWIAEISGVPADVWAEWEADATPVVATQVQMHDGTPLADAVRVIDGGGREYYTHRELVDVERWVCFSDIDRDRATAEERLVVAIDRIAEEHRRAVFAGHADGWDEGESDRIHREYRDRYAAAIAAAQESVRQDMEAQAQRESMAQARSGGERPVGGSVSRSEMQQTGDDLARWAADQERRAEVDGRLAADTIAARVQGEAERAITAGVPESRFTSRGTSGGLAGEASGALTGSEQAGRFRAVDAPPGMRVGYVLRTSVRDRKRCPVCRERDGARYEFPRDRARWGSDPASVVPDPECHGSAARCRCGWIVGWVRIG